MSEKTQSVDLVRFFVSVIVLVLLTADFFKPDIYHYGYIANPIIPANKLLLSLLTTGAGIVVLHFLYRVVKKESPIAWGYLALGNLFIGVTYLMNELYILEVIVRIILVLGFGFMYICDKREKV